MFSSFNWQMHRVQTNKICHVHYLSLPLSLLLWIVFNRGDNTSHLRTAKRFASGRVMMASTLQYISSSTYKDKITLKVLEELLGNTLLPFTTVVLLCHCLLYVHFNTHTLLVPSSLSSVSFSSLVSPSLLSLFSLVETKTQHNQQQQ
jgi:hypothetical protein